MREYRLTAIGGLCSVSYYGLGCSGNLGKDVVKDTREISDVMRPPSGSGETRPSPLPVARGQITDTSFLHMAKCLFPGGGKLVYQQLRHSLLILQPSGTPARCSLSAAKNHYFARMELRLAVLRAPLCITSSNV